MTLTVAQQVFLIDLKDQLVRNRSLGTTELDRVLSEIVLDGISAEDLRAISNPLFVGGVDFNTIDTTTFTTTDMNTIAPGAIDVDELRQKMVNNHLRQGQITDIVDTQNGVVQVKQELRLNSDIEDLMEDKSKSQGVNLQMINLAKNFRKEDTTDKPIQSRFLE